MGKKMVEWGNGVAEKEGLPIYLLATPDVNLSNSVSFLRRTVI